MSFNTDRLSSILSNMETNTANLKYAMKNNVSEMLKKDTGTHSTEIEYLKEEIKRLKDANENIMINRQQEEITRINTVSQDVYYMQTIESLRMELEEAKKKIKTEFETFEQFKAHTENKLKKQLCEILQLKGGIRVITRIKPFISNEKVLLTEDTVEIPSKSFISKCSRVLSPKASQEDLFAEIEDLIYSVTKGYKVSILAYGPTGSGKTYSMEGSSSQNIDCTNSCTDINYLGNMCKCRVCSEQGIVYRSMHLLRAELERMKMLGYKNITKMSVVELYNDKIIHSIEETLPVERISEVFKKMSRNRKVGSTECNLRSSRSHLILTVDVQIERVSETGADEYIEGSLCIGDLAGSERLSHSKAEGDRMKEAVEINKSLSALGDVVYAIANKAAHVPYRNSKLTTLLKKTLGPGAKTAFIINIDPGSSIEETITALRFSNRLQECTLGRSKTVSLEVLRYPSLSKQ